MDSTNFRLFLHTARLAADESLSYVSPFRWTKEQRDALIAYGLANDMSIEQVNEDLDRAERDEAAHKELVDAIDEAEDLEKLLDRELSLDDAAE